MGTANSVLGLFHGCPISAFCEIIPCVTATASSRSGGADKGIAKRIAKRIADAAERLKSDLARKSDPGVVMRADGRVEVMRWGFQRSFTPSIDNARAEKLESGMWAEAFHERRCVIPMTLFMNGDRAQEARAAVSRPTKSADRRTIMGEADSYGCLVAGFLHTAAAPTTYCAAPSSSGRKSATGGRFAAA